MPCVTITVREQPKANIVVTNVSASKTEAYVNEDIAITATVKNIGNATGTANIELKVEGVTKAGEIVTLSPGESDKITWHISFPSTGDFNVCVE